MGVVRERETKLCSIFNSTDSLKYLERGKPGDRERGSGRTTPYAWQKRKRSSGITIHKEYNNHCYVHRTSVMQDVYHLLRREPIHREK